MKIVLPIILLFLCVSTVKADEFEILKNRIIKINAYCYYPELPIAKQIDSIRCFAESPDIMIRELYDYIDETVIENYIKELDESGKWNDINYKDKNRSGWAPLFHTERLSIMSRAYANDQCSFYKNSRLKKAIIKGIDFWHIKKLTCPNWWYNQIGVPKMMGVVYLIMENEFTSMQKQDAIRVMQQSKIGMTGQNKTWLTGNVLVGAILERNAEQISQCVHVLNDVITTTDVEGIKPDWSFHQHGAQQQFGNYGLAYINSLSYWARVLNGTSYALSNDKLEILHKYLIKGIGCTLWNGYMDLNACNRQLFKFAQRGKALSVGRAIINMITVMPIHKNEYDAILNVHVKKQPSKQLNETILYYPYSDMLIARFKDIYFSVKMSSTRVIGAEIVNNENLKGYHTGDGVTSIMLGGSEYKDIYGAWKWYQIPGTTTYQTHELIDKFKGPYTNNKSSFVGGYSDDLFGIATEYFVKDSLSAFKSWIVVDGNLICVGSGIKATNNNAIATTINQCHLMGKVTINKDKKGTSIVRHNGLTYKIMHGDIQCESYLSSGNWQKVAHFYSNRTVQDSIFSLVINHSNKDNNSYIYTIGKSGNENQLQFDVVAQNDTCHHLHFPIYKRHIAILYTAGEIQLGKKEKITIDKGCIFVYNYSNKKNPVIEVIEPTQLHQDINITLHSKQYLFSSSGKNKVRLINHIDRSSKIYLSKQ